MRQNLIDISVAVLGRSPSPQELAAWQEDAENGQTLGELTSLLLLSQEAQDRFPESGTNTDYLTNAYQQLFGRAPDAAGLAYWETQLESGNVDFNTLVAVLVEGARAETGNPNDAAVVNARVEAADNYLASVEAGDVEFDAVAATNAVAAVERGNVANPDLEPELPGDPTPPGDGGGDPTPPGDGGGDPTPPGDGGGDPTPPGDGGGDPTPTPTPEPTFKVAENGVQLYQAAKSSTAVIDITEMQAVDEAATFSITVGDVTLTGLDVSAAAGGTDLASIVEGALRTADGDATDISVSFANDQLTVTDAAGRAISDVSLQTTDVMATDSTAVIDVTDAQAVDDAATFSITVGDVTLTGEDVSAAASGTELASTVEGALRTADGDATDISVSFANDQLTVTDAAGRAISGVSLQTADVMATDSTAVIDVTDVQAVDDAATFSITVGNVTLTGEDVSAAASGTELASTVEGALRTADGDATDISVSFANDQLTVTDAAGRAISGVSLQTADVMATDSTAVIDVTDAQAVDDAATFSITVGDVTLTGEDVSAAASGTELASTVEGALRTADGDATDISVSFANDQLTVTDVAGRAISGVSLQDSTSAEIDSDIVVSNGNEAQAAAEIDSDIVVSNGNEAQTAAEIDSDIVVNNGNEAQVAAEIDSDIVVNPGEGEQLWSATFDIANTLDGEDYTYSLTLTNSNDATSTDATTSVDLSYNVAAENAGSDAVVAADLAGQINNDVDLEGMFTASVNEDDQLVITSDVADVNFEVNSVGVAVTEVVEAA